MTQQALTDIIEHSTSEGLAQASGGEGRMDDQKPARIPLRELEDGQRVKGVYAVRERELRRKRNGEPWLRLVLCDAGGSAEAVCWEDAEALYALAAPGTAVEVGGVFELSERWGAKVKLSSLRAGRARLLRHGRPDARVRGLLRGAGARAAPAAGDRARAAARRAAGALLRRALADLGALPRRAGGEGLPPGLPPRPARAHRLGRPGGQRRRQLLPRHRPRGRGRRRAAARHRQDRRLQRRPAGDRPHRRRPARRRDPARLLHGAPRDRADARLRPAARPGRPAHHPQPPRLARARLAGRAGHPRGRARPHDRQPRRPARQLRPAGARAPRRRVLVALRPGAVGLGVLRRAPRPPERPATTQNAGFRALRRAAWPVPVTILGWWQRTPRS